jgi:hypothetical protein
MNDQKKPPPPKAFSGNDFYRMEQAVEKLMITQLGSMQEHFTAADLRLLFVPHEHRRALDHVYRIEEPSHARGEIWLDLTAVLPIDCTYDKALFDDPQAPAAVKKAVIRLYFQRDFEPEGFVTPTPVFGTRQKPIRSLQGEPPPLLRDRFLENAMLLLRLTAEWSMVRWSMGELQNSLRTPQQMRYVWPATYNIAQTAGLKMDLSTPSSRAGFNAVPSQDVRGYLRETNDVVARSVLMGVNDEYIERYTRKDIIVSNVSIELTGNRSVVFVSSIV